MSRWTRIWLQQFPRILLCSGFSPYEVASDSSDNPVSECILSSEETVFPINANQEIRDRDHQSGRENAYVGILAKRLDDGRPNLAREVEDRQDPNELASKESEEGLGQAVSYHAEWNGRSVD